MVGGCWEVVAELAMGMIPTDLQEILLGITIGFAQVWRGVVVWGCRGWTLGTVSISQSPPFVMVGRVFFKSIKSKTAKHMHEMHPPTIVDPCI